MHDNLNHILTDILLFGYIEGAKAAGSSLNKAIMDFKVRFNIDEDIVTNAAWKIRYYRYAEKMKKRHQQIKYEEDPIDGLISRLHRLLDSYERSK